MKFSVGDRVVHPHHGPGRIASIERKELMDGTKRYYVIYIPNQALTVQVPVRTADEVGVRPAMPVSRLPRGEARLCALSQQGMIRITLSGAMNAG